jgi:hypothetical protein
MVPSLQVADLVATGGDGTAELQACRTAAAGRLPQARRAQPLSSAPLPCRDSSCRDPLLLFPLCLANSGVSAMHGCVAHNGEAMSLAVCAGTVVRLRVSRVERALSVLRWTLGLAGLVVLLWMGAAFLAAAPAAAATPVRLISLQQGLMKGGNTRLASGGDTGSDSEESSSDGDDDSGGDDYSDEYKDSE